MSKCRESEKVHGNSLPFAITEYPSNWVIRFLEHVIPKRPSLPWKMGMENMIDEDVFHLT
jgi:hypothetical protein